jgi:hypothetical protein
VLRGEMEHPHVFERVFHRYLIIDDLYGAVDRFTVRGSQNFE